MSREVAPIYEKSRLFTQAAEILVEMKRIELLAS